MPVAETKPANILDPDFEPQEIYYPTYIFNPPNGSILGKRWETLQEIAESYFGSGNDKLQIGDFSSPQNTIVFLGNPGRRIVGYAVANLSDEETAQIQQLVIQPSEQNRSSVMSVLRTLEFEFREEMGCRYMEGNFPVLNGQADFVQQVYGQQVVEQRDFFAVHEIRMLLWRQRFLKLDLGSPKIVQFPQKILK